MKKPMEKISEACEIYIQEKKEERLVDESWEKEQENEYFKTTNIGKIEIKDWNIKKKELEQQWKEYLKKYKGDDSAMTDFKNKHIWGDLSSDAKKDMPSSSITASLIFKNGVIKDVEYIAKNRGYYFGFWSQHVDGYRQCGICNRVIPFEHYHYSF